MVGLKYTLKIVAFVFLVLMILGMPLPVQADVAPPEQSPGSNPVPGSEITQVQMVSEEVLLVIKSVSKGTAYYANSRVQADVSAHFDMKNQGKSDESMQARFPLMNPSGMGDGFGNYPTIMSLKVKVDGEAVPTTKISVPNPYDSSYPDILWAGFDVSFPVGKAVSIDVTYTLDATGYLPFASFSYILETGAGWKDSIGSADITVRLPYEANNQNVLEGTGWSSTSPDWKYEGNDIHWHLENLEPQKGQNIEVSIVAPYAWQTVLDARQAVEKEPKNGDRWGALARAYKGVIIQKFLRDDPGGLELYRLSVEAYEKATSLAPKVARWHAGYAELLWYHYYPMVFYTNPNEQVDLIKIVQELRTALTLEPGNTQAADILGGICGAIPEAVTCQDSEYTYSILTATVYYTPQPTLTPTGTPVTPATPIPSATVEPASSATLTPIVTDTMTATLAQTATLSSALLTPEITQTHPVQKTSKPLCTPAFLLPLLLVVFPLLRYKIKDKKVVTAQT
jgi:hypothetical protein